MYGNPIPKTSENKVQYKPSILGTWNSWWNWPWPWVIWSYLTVQLVPIFKKGILEGCHPSHSDNKSQLRWIYVKIYIFLWLCIGDLLIRASKKLSFFFSIHPIGGTFQKEKIEGWNVSKRMSHSVSRFENSAGARFFTYVFLLNANRGNQVWVLKPSFFPWVVGVQG